MTRTALLIGLTAGWALSGCGDVSIDQIEPSTGLITGSLLVQEVASPGACSGEPQGNVILSVFNAANPPPPVGSGGSVVFSVVPEAQWLAGGGPLFAADFSIPFLPNGTFLVSGFVDVDGDFSPNVPLLSQPSAGDLAGGFVDATQSLTPVQVERAAVTTGVLVQLGREIPLEPPAFRLGGDGTITAPTTGSSTLALVSSPLDRGPFQHDPQCSGFLVQLVDANRDGVPDDANGDGQPDLLPQVVLTQIEAENPARIVALIDPTNVSGQLFSQGFAITPTLNLRVPPVVLRPGEDGALQPVPGATPPPGAYAVSLFTGTSQRWTVPNEVDLVDPMAGGPSPQSQPLLMR